MTDTDTRSIDPLTGLPTYDAFLRDVARDFRRAEEEGYSIALVLLDLDWFARVNKEHGSERGDAILQELAQYLCETFKGKGAVYRFGGDALMVLLPATTKEQAFLVAEQAREGFQGTHAIAGDGGKAAIALSVSGGVAAYPDDGSKDTDVIRKANEAVYRAKVSGRNKVCLAREEKMVTKTSHFTQGQLEGLSRLAKREGLNEAVLLREAVDDLLRKYNR
jgi:diguanylate cyclase (GGDEF)-like protein